MLISLESLGGVETFLWQKRAEGLQQPDAGFSGHQAFRRWKVPHHPFLGHHSVQSCSLGGIPIHYLILSYNLILLSFH